MILQLCTFGQHELVGLLSAVNAAAVNSYGAVQLYEMIVKNFGEAIGKCFCKPTASERGYIAVVEATNDDSRSEDSVVESSGCLSRVWTRFFWPSADSERTSPPAPAVNTMDGRTPKNLTHRHPAAARQVIYKATPPSEENNAATSLLTPVIEPEPVALLFNNNKAVTAYSSSLGVGGPAAPSRARSDSNASTSSTGYKVPLELTLARQAALGNPKQRRGSMSSQRSVGSSFSNG